MEIPVAEKVAVKDWSNDDTEPGDDEAFSPVIHRIINSPGDEMDGRTITSKCTDNSALRVKIVRPELVEGRYTDHQS